MPNPKISSILAQSLELLDAADVVELSGRPGMKRRVHVFDDWKNKNEKKDRSRLAIKTALASGRALLVRGEPGVGKTQLAEAAAVALKRPLVSFTVDARCESRELQWRFDAVRRLAEAQICGQLHGTRQAVSEAMEERRFVVPGPLWWGFDWAGAAAHCEEHGLDIVDTLGDADPANGRVVLIDEIDKADIELPNGLLEALGSGQFKPPGCERVTMTEPVPLVIVTTNEERVLPDAFIRRCLVLSLSLPDGDDLQSFLVARGREHFPHASDHLLREAAKLLVSDRAESPPPRPGQAEYLDLVRAVVGLGVKPGREKELIESLSEFTFKKQSAAS